MNRQIYYICHSNNVHLYERTKRKTNYEVCSDFGYNIVLAKVSLAGEPGENHKHKWAQTIVLLS